MYSLRVHWHSTNVLFHFIRNNNGQEYLLSGSVRYINLISCDRGLMLWQRIDMPGKGTPIQACFVPRLRSIYGRAGAGFMIGTGTTKLCLGSALCVFNVRVVSCRCDTLGRVLSVPWNRSDTLVRIPKATRWCGALWTLPCHVLIGIRFTLFKRCTR